jgi:hypothetical protein
MRSINEANNHTLVVITANSGIPRILLTMCMISKTVTGIISDRIATLKYLISVFSGRNASCIPKTVNAMATKKDTIVRIT